MGGIGEAECVMAYERDILQDFDPRRKPVFPSVPADLGMVVEGDGIRLVPERPLLERRFADVLGPHRLRLRDHRVRSSRDRPLGDVQHGLTGANERPPVPGVAPADQAIAHEAADRAVGRPEVERPLLLEAAVVGPLVRVDEIHHGSRE